MTQVCVEDLPADLIGCVAEFIDVAAEKERCLSLVTASPTLTYKAAQTIALWEPRGYFAERSWSLGKPADVALLQARNEFIDEVSAIDGNAWQFSIKLDELTTNKDLRAVPTLAHLSAISLRGCTALTSSEMKTVLQLPRLSKLDIRDCPRLRDDLPISICATLTELAIGKTAKSILAPATASLVTDTLAVAIAGLKGLSKLTIGAEEDVTESSVTIILMAAEHIAELTVPSLKLVSEALAGLISLRNKIQVLDLSGCEKINDAAVQNIVGLPELRVLRLGSASKFSSRAAALLLERNSITDLTLTEATKLTDRVCHSFGRISSLKALRLAGCVNLYDVAVEYLTENDSLEILRVSKCARLTDDAFAHLSRLSRLRDVDLSFNMGLTEAAVGHLVGLPIESLSIAGCRRVGDGVMVHIANLAPSLTSLDLSFTSLTDAGALELQRLPQLRSLRLRGAKALTNAAIKVVSVHLTQLRALDVGLLDISDAALSEISQLGLLEQLDVSFCRRLTIAGARRIGMLTRLGMLVAENTALVSSEMVQILPQKARAHWLQGRPPPQPKDANKSNCAIC